MAVRKKQNICARSTAVELQQGQGIGNNNTAIELTCSFPGDFIYIYIDAIDS